MSDNAESLTVRQGAAAPTTCEAGTTVGLSDAVVEARDVRRDYGQGDALVRALVGVDIDLQRGAFTAIMGPSGSGKSTLMHILAGLDRPTSGTVGTGGKTAFMFQDATLLPWLTAAQNVALALRLRGVPRGERGDLTRSLLERVRLGSHADRRPHELSGGMRQRVALARVLAQDAPVVLMDEPLGALDAMTRDRMHDEIERVWAEAGLTVLFVTHNVREAVRLGDRVVLMGSSPGRIVTSRPIELPRPRRLDSAGVAELAAELTAELREEGARRGG